MINLGKNMSSTDAGFEQQDFYSKGIDYEGLLNQQTSRISYFRSTKKYEEYFSSVDTLVLMLPKELRGLAMDFKKQNNISYNMSSSKGVDLYDRLWDYCNTLLEENNLTFKTRYIKTYS